MSIELLRTDDRGVSSTVNYVLALAITTVLLSSLVVSTSGLVDDRRERATEAELRAIGNQLASDLMRAATLSSRGADVTIRSTPPDLTGGTAYSVELAPCPGSLDGRCLRLTAADPAVTTVVPVYNTTPVSITPSGEGWVIETTGTGSSAEPPRSVAPVTNIGVGSGVSARPSQRDVIDPRNREPIPGFVFEPSYPFPNQTVVFVNDTTDLDGNIAGFEWDFGDGSSNVTGSVTSHSYATPGRYDVTLVVTDDEMASASLSKQVIVTGLVYNNDARSRDPDNDGSHGGVKFSVVNEFNTTVELSEVYIDPLAPTSTVTSLSDRVDGTGPDRSEVYVDADQDAWYDYGQHEFADGEDNVDSTDGEILTTNGTIADLDFELGNNDDGSGGGSGDVYADLATSEQNARVDPGSTATIELTEFRDGVSMAGRNITVGLRYRTDGEQYTSRFVIEPIGGPDAAFSISDDNPDEGQPIDFDASSSTDPEGSISTYAWDFGDGTTASGLTPSHSYSSPGKYVVTLSVTDDDGFTDTATKIVFVQDDDVVWAVNAGGSGHSSDNGIIYRGDEKYTGGTTYDSGNAIDATTDDFVYQSERYGDFTYETSLPNDEYEVTLKFAEVYWNSDNDRVFDVLIEGDEEISDLDIHSQVGANTAHDETRIVNVTDGKLTIEFDTDVDNAKLAAIVVREADGGGSPKMERPPVELRTIRADGPTRRVQ